jgi:hypothetical protein
VATYALSTANRLVYVIAGHVYGVRTDTMELIDYSSQAGVGELDPDVERCYFCTADRYMIIQDGINIPIIIEDAVARRAVQTHDATQTVAGVYDHPETWEVPIGTIMAYGQGRLFVVPKVLGNGLDGRRFFYAGDIILATDPSTVLRFTETTYLSGGGAFGLPADMGFITGMAFLRNAGTGSGQGALCVFAEKGVSSFDVWKPRANVSDAYGNLQQPGWQDVDISHVLFMDSGMVSPFSIIPVNNDLYFRGVDGIRSINFTVAETTQGVMMRNTPISQEVWPILRYDFHNDLHAVQMAYVGNRMFCLSVPDRDATEPAYKAMVVMDANAQATLAAQASLPIWDGAWSGLTILGLAVARHADHERDALYLFSRNTDGTLALYMLEDDGYRAGQSDSIQCRVYSRGYTFGEMLDRKVFQYMKLDLSAMQGTVVVRGYYRPCGFPYWARMQRPSDDAITFSIPSGGAQRRQGLRFVPYGNPKDSSTNTSLKMARAYEFMIEWEGYAQVDTALFYANHMMERPYPACGTETSILDLEPGEDFRDCDPFGPWEDPYVPFVPSELESWDPAETILTPKGNGTYEVTNGDTLPDGYTVPVWQSYSSPGGNGGFFTPTSLPWTGNKVPKPSVKPALFLHAYWNEGNTGSFACATNTVPAEQGFTVKALCTINTPVVTVKLTGGAGLETVRTSVTVINCKTDPSAPAELKGQSFYLLTYAMTCRAHSGYAFAIGDAAFTITITGTTDNKKKVTCLLAGRLTVTEADHIFGFKVASASPIDRDETFDLELTLWDMTLDVAAPDYELQGDVALTLENHDGEVLDVTTVTPIEFTDGVALIYQKITGGTGTRGITIHADEPIGDVSGTKVLTIKDADVLTLKLTCPEHVVRGVPFDLTVQGWNATTNAADETYVPATTVTITKSVGDDDIVDGPIVMDDADWVDGAKTVSVTLDGGAGDLIETTLHGQDDSVTREGTVDLDVSDPAVVEEFSLKLTCPAHVARGEAFLLTIQGWNDTTGLPDTSYVPSTTVTLTVSVGTDTTINGGAALVVDATDWTNGAKTVSVILTGGTGEEVATTIHGQDDSVAREGSVNLDVSVTPPSVTVAFEGYLRGYNADDGEHFFYGSSGPFVANWVSGAGYYEARPANIASGWPANIVTVRYIYGSWRASLEVYYVTFPPYNAVYQSFWTSGTRHGAYTFSSNNGPYGTDAITSVTVS